MFEKRPVLGTILIVIISSTYDLRSGSDILLNAWKKIFCTYNAYLFINELIDTSANRIT